MTPEEERLDQVKQWWKEYRWTVIGGVSAGVIGVGGWTGWNEYTRVQQELASALFQELSVAVVQADVTGARRAFDELFEDYSGTAYAEKARLLFARAAYEVGEEADARRLLEDAVDLSSDESTAHTARIRLAQLLIQSAQYQEALDLLGSVDPGQFASHYEELKGDAYRAMNRYSEAKKAYEASLDLLGFNSGYRTILTLKLNDTRVAE